MHEPLGVQSAAHAPGNTRQPSIQLAGEDLAVGLTEGGGAAGRKRFVTDIAAIPGKAPLRLAGEWEAWLKGKESLAAGFDMNTLVSWMQRWIADAIEETRSAS